MQVNDIPVHYLRSNAELVDAAAGWLQLPFITLDTEFMRVRTFYPDAALFQVCTGERAYLIDPTTITDLSPLTAVLQAPSVLKIMHSCSEDLEVCDRHLGALPEPLYDTQVAGAFSGMGLSVGYQRMLKEVLDYELDKSETRTDWLQRPLSDAQLRYAAEDVVYLVELWHALEERLQGRDAAAWVREECAAILARFRARDPGSEYAGVNGAWRLGPGQLTVLRELYLWREETARERNMPRNWVAPDKALLQLAQYAPTSPGQLNDIDDLQPSSIRRFGSLMLDVIAAARTIPAEEQAAPLPKPLSAADGKRLKRLKAVVNARAESLGIAPEMLARRRDYEDIVRYGADSDCALFSGWRFEQCGRAVLEELEGSG